MKPKRAARPGGSSSSAHAVAATRTSANALIRSRCLVILFSAFLLLPKNFQPLLVGCSGKSKGYGRKGERVFISEASAGDQALQLGARTNDRLVAFGTCGNPADFNASALFQKLQIRASGFGQRLITGNAARGRLPARQSFVDRLHGFQSAIGRGHLANIGAMHTVAHANGDLRELVEHVQLSHHYRVEPVDHGAVSKQRNVEPAAAARASRDGAILIAFAPKQFAAGAVVLGRERS